MEKLLERIEKYILYAILFLVPIVVAGISPNPFVVPKLALLVYGVALLLLVRAVRVIATGKLELMLGTYDFPVFLLALAYAASSILRTPNKMEAYLLPGTATAIVAGALIYYLVNQLKEQDKHILKMLMFGSAVLFSLMTLLAFSGLLNKIPQLPAYVRAQGFTPEGGYLPAAIFLATILPLGIGLIMTEKEKATKALFGVAAGVVGFALAVSIFNLIPGRPFSPRFPSMNVSWAVAVDALKESPILGVGPGNYLTAFNRFRPLSFNQSDLWAVKFATANNYFFTLMTEVGMLGVAAIILLLVTAYKTINRDLKEQKLVNWGFAGMSNVVSLVLILLVLAVFPATILIMILLFVYLSFNAKTKHTTLSLTTQGSSETAQGFSTQQVASRFPALLITLPVVIGVILLGYRASRILIGEYTFTKSLNALVKNDAAKTYDTLRSAIQINPYVDRYHATNARVNLALANAIAQKQDITDQDRQNITLLIQQAINEGKATVALNTLRAQNWETLSQVYRAIIPLAQGADSFAVQTYRQAVALDPFNPNLRIALGGIHYQAKDYDGAIRIFESATAAKNDHANAHYNLAFALRDKGDLNRSIQELSVVLSLIKDKSSQDYEVAKKALEDLEAKRKEQAPAGQELTSPSGEQGPSLQPPINLPEGSEPPQAPLSPTPTPAAGTNAPSPTPLP